MRVYLRTRIIPYSPRSILDQPRTRSSIEMLAPHCPFALELIRENGFGSTASSQDLRTMPEGSTSNAPSPGHGRGVEDTESHGPQPVTSKLFIKQPRRFSSRSMDAGIGRAYVRSLSCKGK